MGVLPSHVSGTHSAGIKAYGLDFLSAIPDELKMLNKEINKEINKKKRCLVLIPYFLSR
jgi:hypothetical protein